MRYLFVCRAYPDIDHMAPLAWKLLEEGDEVHAVISPGYDPDADHHLRFLRGYERFHVHESRPTARGRGRAARALGPLRGWVAGTLPWALVLLLRHRVRVVAVEWGPGPRSDRRTSPAGALAVLRRLAGSVLKAGRGDPMQLRSNFVLAGWMLDRPVVCLPHGLSVKLDVIARGKQAERFERDGTIDWTDRNRFAAYVLNTEHHRRWHLEHASGDPAVMETWGSMRWSPEWFEVNRRIAPRFPWPDPGAARVKVVFMVPKWRNRASPEAALELVKRLQALDCVSLAIKPHPRKEGAADPLRADPEIDWDRIHDLSDVDSVAAISACDVVIDVGSSIGIEAVMQGKTLVNPNHLHGIRTLFDSIEGSCVRADSADEVVAYLHSHARGVPHRVPGEAYAELLRRAVYGDREEPFDVLGLYASRVRALASVPAES
jgi:hypothetical protein